MQLAGEREAGFLGERAHGGDGALGQRVEVEVGGMRAPCGRLGPAVDEDAVDDRKRVARVVVDVGRVAAVALIGDGAEALVLHDLGGDDDGAQGRLELVRELGEGLAFRGRAGRVLVRRRRRRLDEARADGARDLLQGGSVLA